MAMQDVLVVGLVVPFWFCSVAVRVGVVLYKRGKQIAVFRPTDKDCVDGPLRFVRPFLITIGLVNPAMT